MSSIFSIGSTAFCLSSACLSLADGAQPADIKALAREVNADIRKVDNMTDKAAARPAHTSPLFYSPSLFILNA